MTRNRPLHLSDAQSRTNEPEDPALAAAVAAVVWHGDDDFLLARIQRARAAGERVQLPPVSAEPARAPLRTRRQRWMARWWRLLGVLVSLWKR